MALVQLSLDLERFFELTTDVCCVLTFNGIVQASNAAWLSILGYPRQDIQGASLFELLHPDERAQIESALLKQPRSSFAGRCRGKDGTYRLLRWQSLAAGEQRKVYVIARPETLDLSRSERLMSLGQIALGVVHDLKNVVVHPLGLQLHRIDRALESDAVDRARVAAAAMREALRDGTDAIDRLLRPQDHQLVREVDLDAIAWKATELARAYARAHAIEFDWQPGAPAHIQADAFDLLTAFVNVLFNAVDALAERGGTITVKTGGSAWITISDNGPGMTADVRDRVFEPFFTTKPDGVGLGLSIVNACMVRHGASIRMITAPGAGTTVRIELPA